jgi:hypothetical protein
LNVSLIGVSVVFNLLAVAIGLYMMDDIRYLRENQEEDNTLPLLDKWGWLPKTTVAVNAGIIASSMFVLYKQLTKK